MVPKRPEKATAWVDGEWVLRHGRWLWLLGRWVEAPAGARYAPWVTVRGTDGTLYYAPSTWVDDAGAPREPPPPLALARASGEAVFTAGGEIGQTGRNIENLPQAPDAGARDAAGGSEEPADGGGGD